MIKATHTFKDHFNGMKSTPCTSINVSFDVTFKELHMATCNLLMQHRRNFTKIAIEEEVRRLLKAEGRDGMDWFDDRNTGELTQEIINAAEILTKELYPDFVIPE